MNWFLMPKQNWSGSGNGFAELWGSQFQGYLKEIPSIRNVFIPINGYILGVF